MTPDFIKNKVGDLERSLDAYHFDSFTAFELYPITFNSVLSVHFKKPFSIIRPIPKLYGTKKSYEGIMGEQMVLLTDFSMGLSHLECALDLTQENLKLCLIQTAFLEKRLVDCLVQRNISYLFI